MNYESWFKFLRLIIAKVIEGKKIIHFLKAKFRIVLFI